MVRDMRNRFWICLVSPCRSFIYAPMGGMFTPAPPSGLESHLWLFFFRASGCPLPELAVLRLRVARRQAVARWVHIALIVAERKRGTSLQWATFALQRRWALLTRCPPAGKFILSRSLAGDARSRWCAHRLSVALMNLIASQQAQRHPQWQVEARKCRPRVRCWLARSS